MIGPGSTALPQDSQSNVDIDLPCFKCHYNLRSIAWDSNCPECGAPVRDSADRGWLQFANPDWLRKVRWGVDLSIILFVLVIVGLIAASIYLFSEFLAKKSPPSPDDFAGLNIVLGLLYQLALITIALLITWPEASRVEGAKPRRPTLSRWIVGLMIGGALPGIMVGLIAKPPATPQEAFSGPFLITVPLTFLSAVATYVAGFLMIIHVRRIARRDMAGGLAKMMSFILWGAVGLFGVGLICAVLMIVGVILKGPQILAGMTTTGTTTSSAPALPPWLAAATSQPASGSTEIVISNGRWTMSQPAGGTSGTVGAPPPMPPIVRGMMIGMCPLAIAECFALVWMVCAVVSIFWFRIVLSRAINENVGHLCSWPDRTQALG